MTTQQQLKALRRRASSLFADLDALLRKLDATPAASPLSKVALIQSLVARHYNIPEQVMTSGLRPNVYAHPRMVAMVLCSELTRYHPSQIATSFNKDRGSLLHAVKWVQRRRDTEPVFAAEYASLKAVAAQQLHHTEMPLFQKAQ